MAGNSSLRVLRVQSPAAETISIGRGAVIAAISTLLISESPPRKLGALWHPPPCSMAEILLTGALTVTRSSAAVNMKHWRPPLEAPVHPIRLASTSGNEVRKSTERMLFQRCSPKELMFHNASPGLPNSWGTWLVSL